MGRKPNRPGAQSGASGRSVTIKDLAAELGLSITTISRALNGYPDVGEKTRKRISEVAQKLGYRPNRNAQRLVTQQLAAHGGKRVTPRHFYFPLIPAKAETQCFG